MSDSGEYVWRTTRPDYYGPLRQRLPFGDLIRQFVLRSAINQVVDVLSMTESCSVLDVGCGTGILARRLSDHGFRVTGVDVSRTMIRRARKVAPRIRLDWQDAALMAYEREFDAAVVSLVVHEIGPAARIEAWNNILRAVAAGGFVIVLDFTEPTTDSSLSRLIRACIERDERAFDRVNPDHYTNYRQFMADGGLREWLRSVDADVEIEMNFLGTNLGLFVVRV